MKKILITIICVIATLMVSSCNKKDGPSKKTAIVTISSQYNAEKNTHTVTLNFNPTIRKEAKVYLDVECEQGIKTTLQNIVNITAWSTNITLNVPVEWTGQPQKDQATIKVKIREVTGEEVNCDIGEPSEVILKIKK